MTAKLSIQPLCRCCGKSIKKRVSHVYFGSMALSEESRRFKDVKPMSKAEIEKLVNGQVLSVGWSIRFDYKDGKDVRVKEYIDRATVWDGESYEDDLFCTMRCADAFGRAMAREGWKTKSYDAALEAQRARQSESV